MSTGIANHGVGYDQTPISDWGVSDDEEDLVPITKLIAIDKQPVRGHRKDNSEWGKRMEKHFGQIERRLQGKEGSSNPTVIPLISCMNLMSERETDETAKFGEVLTRSEDEFDVQEIFVKGHVNLGKTVAKFFDGVLHEGIVTEVIPRRRDFYYKVTYGDGDQEDMDEAELLYAMELRQKKDDGQDISPEAEGDDVELSGLSEEGSVYDSEEDKKALKEAKRKRQSSAQKQKDT
jgi:hypothetical protein